MEYRGVRATADDRAVGRALAAIAVELRFNFDLEVALGHARRGRGASPRNGPARTRRRRRACARARRATCSALLSEHGAQALGEILVHFDFQRLPVTSAVSARVRHEVVVSGDAEGLSPPLFEPGAEAVGGQNALYASGAGKVRERTALAHPHALLERRNWREERPSVSRIESQRCTGDSLTSEVEELRVGVEAVITVRACDR